MISSLLLTEALSTRPSPVHAGGITTAGRAPRAVPGQGRAAGPGRAALRRRSPVAAIRAGGGGRRSVARSGRHAGGEVIMAGGRGGSRAGAAVAECPAMAGLAVWYGVTRLFLARLGSAQCRRWGLKRSGRSGCVAVRTRTREQSVQSGICPLNVALLSWARCSQVAGRGGLSASLPY